MNKTFTIFLLLTSLLPGFINGQEIPIAKVRKLYFSMEKNDGARKLFALLEKADLSKQPVFLAYRGSALAASAASADGVFKKLDCFNRGKDEIEKAVALKPLDVEIRFVRLATQVSTPGFLGYRHEIEADKAFIIKSINCFPANQPNAYFYQRICMFLASKVELGKQERILVNQLIDKFKSN